MAGTVIFSLRPDSFNARYAPGGATGNKSISTPTIDAGAGTGIIGNSVINLDQGATSTYGVFYRGTGNIPKTQKFSVLLRCALGTTSGTLALFGLGGFPNIGNMGAFFVSNSLRGFTENYTNASDIMTINESWTPSTATYYDIVYLIDMSTTSTNSKVYVDGVQVGSSRGPSSTWSSNRLVEHMQIALGSTYFGGTTSTRMKVNEFVIWDDIIDPTSGGLNLNGASRSSFVTASVLDGLSYSDPGIANVRLSTAYTQAGVSLTGTAAIPTAANTRLGTAVDATTGTLAVPSAANVLLSVAVDNTTGTYVGPSIANVKFGVTFGALSALTGTYDGSDRWTAPSAGDLRLGIQLKNNSTSLNLTGTMVANTAADTKHGVASDGGTGIYRGADLYDVVAAADLKHGVTKNQDGSSVLGIYRAADLFDVVAATDLKHGVTKNQDGSSVLGTYRGADLYDVVSASELKHGVTRNQDGSSVLGTYRGADLWSALAAADIRAGTSQTQDGAGVTGLLDLPSEADVLLDTDYDNGTKTGTLVVGATYHPILTVDEIAITVDDQDVHITVEGE